MVIYMAKHIYISADYSTDDGDRAVVFLLKKWGSDNLHKVDFIDMAEVRSGSVSLNEECFPCDLKAEFNRQINASSAVIFVIGNKTKDRKAGSQCTRFHTPFPQECCCTPYKQNRNGIRKCKYADEVVHDAVGYIGEINNFSYIQHEFKQARLKNKRIIIIYNSLLNEEYWLPDYMKNDLKEYDNYVAGPFWILNKDKKKVGNYDFIKKALDFA